MYQYVLYNMIIIYMFKQMDVIYLHIGDIFHHFRIFLQIISGTEIALLWMTAFKLF